MSINPIKLVRRLVSKKKERFQDKDYDLDLTYITNYVIAMGFPSEGLEKAIRNSRDDVVQFLKQRHGILVKIYNLCIEPSKQYSQDKIGDFSYGCYPFMDHNICSIRTIFNICVDMFLFIQQMNQLKMFIQHCLIAKNKGNQLTPEQLSLIEKDITKHQPVVAVHCKAGKGRTGLIICCFLLFTGAINDPQKAIEHYDKIRTSNKKALTI